MTTRLGVAGIVKSIPENAATFGFALSSANARGVNPSLASGETLRLRRPEAIIAAAGARVAVVLDSARTSL
jgi:hypothetical protein